jgi:hypothetical protein
MNQSIKGIRLSSQFIKLKRLPIRILRKEVPGNASFVQVTRKLIQHLVIQIAAFSHIIKSIWRSLYTDQSIKEN